MKDYTYILYKMHPEIPFHKLSFTDKEVDTNQLKKVMSFKGHDIVLVKYQEYLNDVTRTLGRLYPNSVKHHSFSREDWITIFKGLLDNDEKFFIHFVTSTDDDYSPEVDDFQSLQDIYMREGLSGEHKKEYSDAFAYLLEDFGLEVKQMNLMFNYNENTYRCEVNSASVILPPDCAFNNFQYKLTEEEQEEVVLSAYKKILQSLYSNQEYKEVNEEIVLNRKEKELHPLHNAQKLLERVFNGVNVFSLVEDLDISEEEVNHIMNHYLDESAKYKDRLVYKK